MFFYFFVLGEGGGGCHHNLLPFFGGGGKKTIPVLYVFTVFFELHISVICKLLVKHFHKNAWKGSVEELGLSKLPITQLLFETWVAC